MRGPPGHVLPLSGRPSIKHKCYHKIFDQQPPWDFDHVLQTLSEQTPEGANCYLFGGSEGHLLGASIEPVLVPFVAALITTAAAPTTFGIQHKDKDEELVPLAALGCEWKPVEGHSALHYLHCRHVKETAEIDGCSEEEQAKYGYTNLFIEPEKMEPDADPEKVGCLGHAQGCSRREGTSEAAPEAVRQAVGRGLVVKAVGGGYCRSPILRLALRIRRTAAGHRLGALEWGGGGYLPPFQCIPGHA